MTNYAATSNSDKAVRTVRALRKRTRIACNLSAFALVSVATWGYLGRSTDNYGGLQAVFMAAAVFAAVIAIIMVAESSSDVKNLLTAGTAVRVTRPVRLAYSQHINRLGVHPDEDEVFAWQREVDRTLEQCAAKARDQRSAVL